MNNNNSNDQPESNNNNNDMPKASMQARQKFGQAVQVALEKLLEQGFSRERATAALLRHILGVLEKPSDTQVFAFMEKYGLGNQQALLALTVTTALRSKFSKNQNGIADMEEGLAALTEAVQQVPQHPSIDPTENVVQDNKLLSEVSNISLPKLSSEKPNKITSDKKQKAKSTRKRVLESSSTSEASDKKRLRADSVSEEVTAKVEEASSAVRSAPTEKVKSTPVVRNKRSRSVEETEVPTAVQAGKRRKSTTA